MNHDMSMSHAVSDEALDEIVGGGSIFDKVGLPAPLYPVGTGVRILSYDNSPYITRYARGAVCEIEYKNKTWRYRLTYMDGSKSQFFREDELGTV